MHVHRGICATTDGAQVAAYSLQAGQVAYAASKGAVVGMTLPMARDLAPLGVRVCAVAPGVFETPMMAGASEELQASLAATIPCPKRLGRPAEFGKLVGAIIENPYLSAPPAAQGPFPDSSNDSLIRANPRPSQRRPRRSHSPGRLRRR